MTPSATASVHTAPASAVPTRAALCPKAFYLRHLVWPLAVLLPISVALMGLGGDRAIADLFYAWQGGHWALRSHVLTEDLLHRGGRLACAAAWLVVVALWGAAAFRERLRPWRRPLLYLALAVPLATGTVSLLKSLTHVDCPWDLLRYGGTREFVGLLESLRPGRAHGACFPAGHASGGYAWVSLYFFALHARPAWRGPALAIGLAAGAVFGIAQQLRGAHFLSHDLWSLAVCWLVALGLHRGLLARPAVALPSPWTASAASRARKEGAR